MYTWGYIKAVALSKLDMSQTSNEPEVLELTNRFPYYANEVMTQICSSIKPKYTYYEFTVTEENSVKNMPTDFISFGDDNNYIEETDNCGKIVTRFANDDDFVTYGYNSLLFKKKGTYRISYNARWIDFCNTGDTPIDDYYALDIPADILDCIPSYIASQCYKIDDEYKAQVYRNEYEMFLARIDNTNYKNTKTFHIRGGW